MATVRVQKMSDIMGCTPQTIRKWCRDGKIPYHTNPGGQLIFTEADIKQALGEQNNATTPLKPQIWAYYLRSSQGLTNLLNNQKTKLETIYPAPKYILKDRASGLNENRSGLNRLLKLAENGDITDVAITTQDRLTRFGRHNPLHLKRTKPERIRRTHERLHGARRIIRRSVLLTTQQTKQQTPA